ncbi:hypothetical protein GUITHDRAFT_147725 [Guillardia theta CCMP2712]|uniref:Uncharacterized protein n=1 Tax=Guillardia theta (strain CCMP2712) TaxID=905079 RepID=L1IC83_GUITC|nr:hypothetical protein GUITHDRAFT_147725 [Guillardia theta CCMP2712]EKX33707.1 hypothetical protein GUITHDRAFT_147725 [Guillardia theta CCMP2712]|eukprot:XP_005820687.1 hypothetical protein GUITHDRAFT_147725 [Guillardia theta CCMP2712]
MLLALLCLVLLAPASAFAPALNSIGQGAQLNGICGMSRTAKPCRARLCGLRMNNKDTVTISTSSLIKITDESKTFIDKVASRGIWQGDLPDEAQEALARVGWVEDNKGGDEERIAREDIEKIVERVTAEETFADERSKLMFMEDTREKILKEVIRQELKAEYGVELEDLLNPIKSFKAS